MASTAWAAAVEIRGAVSILLHHLLIIITMIEKSHLRPTVKIKIATATVGNFVLFILTAFVVQCTGSFIN